MNDHQVNRVTTGFSGRFHAMPLIVRAPGRFNLIGEHTDYNEGFVLPAAVDQSIYFAIGRSQASTCTVLALDFEETFEFDATENLTALPPNHWQNYILGVVNELKLAGYEVGGFSLAFCGDIPQGAGMSSSAALECGTCFAISELFDLKVPRLDIVKMSQRAEHTFAGVKCGIMDQFASTMSKKDHALLLDCRSLEYEHYPIDLGDYQVLLFNSNVSHNLASSEYNVRRAQCEEGIEAVQREFPDIQSLRDVSMDQLMTVKAKMPEVVFSRCKYVIEENDRVLSFAKSLKAGELRRAGEILKKAQQGMKSEYEITCPETEFLAGFANQHQGVLGARQMGGGFGGCVISLVHQHSVDELTKALDAAYQKKFNIMPTPISVSLAEGVGRVAVSE